MSERLYTFTQASGGPVIDLTGKAPRRAVTLDDVLAEARAARAEAAEATKAAKDKGHGLIIILLLLLCAGGCP